MSWWVGTVLGPNSSVSIMQSATKRTKVTSTRVKRGVGGGRFSELASRDNFGP